jgi:microcystin-dependent protein
MSGFEGTTYLGLSKPYTTERDHVVSDKMAYSLQQLDDRWTPETPTTISITAGGTAADSGDSTNVARADHIHGAPTTASIASSARVPGMVAMWPVNTPPTGWLICNGDAVNRTTYANLFAVISTVFGAGDGSTTFNLPDYRDRSPMGANTTVSIGGTAGASTVNSSHVHSGPNHAHSGPSHQHSGPSHTHTDDHDHPSGTTSQGSPAGEVVESGSGETVSDNVHTHSFDVAAYTGSTGSDGTGSTGSSGTGDTGSAGTGDTGSGGSTTLSIQSPVFGVHMIIAH